MKIQGNALAGGIYGDQHYQLPRANGVRRPNRPWCCDCKRTLDADQLDNDGRCERCARAAVARAEAAVRREQRLAQEAEQRKAQQPAPARLARNSRANPPLVRKPRPHGPHLPRGGQRGPRPWEHTEALIEDYKTGQSLPKLAEKYDVSRGRIRNILKHHGIEIRDDRATNSGGRNKAEFPAELVDQVRRLYIDEELSRTQVAAAVGMTVTRVETLMRNHGIAARQRQSGVGDGAKGLKAQMRDLGVTARDVKMWALGRGLIDDATKTGIPSQRLVDAYAEAQAP